MGNLMNCMICRALSWWSPKNDKLELPVPSGDECNEGDDESASDGEKDTLHKPDRQLSEVKRRELEEFRKQLAAKREVRRKIIAEKKNERHRLMERLDEESRKLSEATNENKILRTLIAKYNVPLPTSIGDVTKIDENVPDKGLLSSMIEMESRLADLEQENKIIKCELSECHLANNSLTMEVDALNKENLELKNHVQALKDVNQVSKEMLVIREAQLTQLKEKLLEIESSLADREMKTLSTDLKAEYERQLENIRNLKVLYEERARLAENTKRNLIRDLEQQKYLADSQTRKCGELETKVEELEKEISDKNDVLGTRENQLGLFKAEAKDLQTEMTFINQLFSQMLLGFNATQDLDKLVLKLEENHDLLADMIIREDCSEVASALPKLIIDLLSQMETAEQNENIDVITNEDNNIDDSKNLQKGSTAAEEIVGNLPKVWKVLMELLSHQAGPKVVQSDIIEKTINSCYKSIETPSGPRLVPSVSKTYIRLKDLILEKKSLQKEMTNLKQLNSHLENRLQDQERRLGLVSSELNKTWHIVGKMQRQHQQLHSQEQILRFELQQKRVLLGELKEELEFCKEKWDKAKQKNSESQEEWNKLRVEFTNRKIQSIDSVNSCSAESGYSDEKGSDDDSHDSSCEKKHESKWLRKRNKMHENKNANLNSKKCLNLNNDSTDSDILHKNCDESNDSIYNKTDSVKCEENDRVDINTHNEDIEPIAESSTSSKTSNTVNNYDDLLATRSARLKKLEEQCYVLVNKVTKTNNKGVQLCNRLEELHNQYGKTDDTDSQQTNIDDNNCNEQNNTDHDLANDILGVTNDETGHSSSAHQDNSLNINSEEDKQTDILSDNTQNMNLNEIEEKSDNNIPSSSSISDYETRFAAREERLQRMEEQAKSLVNKVSNTSLRGTQINSKLDELHNVYGKSVEENTNGDENTSEETVITNTEENSETLENELEATEDH